MKHTVNTVKWSDIGREPSLECTRESGPEEGGSPEHRKEARELSPEEPGARESGPECTGMRESRRNCKIRVFRA